jgi:streptogramin lyase
MVHGGQNPVVGAQVLAYQAGSSGYGKGEKPIACTVSDSKGRVTFGAVSPLCSGTGLPAGLSCPVTGSPQLYFLAQGGNPGVGANSALLLMAAVGNCNNLSSRSFVTINEVTTVASVWALSQFMNCAGGGVDTAGAGCGANSREVGATATNATGLSNAMALVGNLVDLGIGVAQSPVPGKTPPFFEVNTLGDILQDCVNSTGPASTACHSLFTCAVPGSKPATGNIAPCTVLSGAIVPSDTLAAGLDIARNPVNNVIALFNLTSKTPAFTPVLAAAPSDWTIAVNYSSSSLSGPNIVALDAAGNAWVANTSGASVSKISPVGGFLNGSAGFKQAGLSFPAGVAIDLTGNAWVISGGSLPLVEFDPGGVVRKTVVGGGLNNPFDIAIDAIGDIWIADAIGGVVEVSPVGAFPTRSFTGGGLDTPAGIAVDAVGNLWVANENGKSVTELSPSGTFLSPTSGCPGTTNCAYTGGGISQPAGIQVDPAGNAWVLNQNIASLTELAPDGAFLSPTSGCPGTTNCGYFGGGTLNARAVRFSIDSAGNVWVAVCGNFCDHGNTSVAEFNSSGTILSPNSGCPGATNCGFTGGAINGAFATAIDSAGDVWVTNAGSNSITQIMGAAAPVLTPLSACLALHTGRAVCLP